MSLVGVLSTACNETVTLTCKDLDRVYVRGLGRFNANDFALGAILAIDGKTNKAIAPVTFLAVTDADRVVGAESDQSAQFSASFEASAGGKSLGGFKGQIEATAKARTYVRALRSRRTDLRDPYALANAQRATILPAVQREMKGLNRELVVVRSVVNADALRLEVDGVSTAGAEIEVPTASGSLKVKYSCSEVADKTGTKVAAFFKVRGIRYAGDAEGFTFTEFDSDEVDYSRGIDDVNGSTDAGAGGAVASKPPPWPAPPSGCQ